MKKQTKFASKLILKKVNIVQLNAADQKVMVAGDDSVTKRNSYLCLPPFNAPPYFYPDKP